MKYVVAVSGGVDSVVLLDMLVKANDHDIIVAHFDHGIRKESASDARFVALLARMYGCEYVTTREELGASASEELARTKRYTFLRSVASQHGATIVTAHHRDDVVETIAINLVRGTGWRGLAVLGDPKIARPLTIYNKQDLYMYALTHGLEWVEDETNATGSYLRNRIRKKLTNISSDTKNKIAALWIAQNELVTKIDALTTSLKTTSRYDLIMSDEATALELLRAKLLDFSLSLTRPQRKQLLHAIKTAAAGTKFEPGSGATIEFTLREFIVKHPL